MASRTAAVAAPGPATTLRGYAPHLLGALVHNHRADNAGPNADNWAPFSANAGTWWGQLVRYNADMSKAAEGPTCVRVEVSEHQAIIDLQRDAEVHILKMCSL